MLWRHQHIFLKSNCYTEHYLRANTLIISRKSKALACCPNSICWWAYSQASESIQKDQRNAWLWISLLHYHSWRFMRNRHHVSLDTQKRTQLHAAQSCQLQMFLVHFPTSGCSIKCPCSCCGGFKGERQQELNVDTNPVYPHKLHRFYTVEVWFQKMMRSAFVRKNVKLQNCVDMLSQTA